MSKKKFHYFQNNDMLTTFINTLNGKDGAGSHLVSVPPGPHLSDALISSPVIQVCIQIKMEVGHREEDVFTYEYIFQGEDGTGAAGLGGAGFEFGVDPNEDPELALVNIFSYLFCCYYFLSFHLSVN